MTSECYPDSELEALRVEKALEKDKRGFTHNVVALVLGYRK